MTKVLLTLIVPHNVAEHVEDLLLSRPDLCPGFSSTQVAGHGSAVPLVAPAEQVAGHAPRTALQTAGDETAMRELLALIKHHLPRANLFFWLQPVIDMGKL